MGAKSLTVSFKIMADDITSDFEQQEWGQGPGDGRQSTPVAEMNLEVPGKVTTRQKDCSWSTFSIWNSTAILQRELLNDILE